MRFQGALVLLLAVVTVGESAAQCMVPPTDRQVVSGRFGKFRGGGANNHGSANTSPHMHDGLDFSTSNASMPLYATTAGEVIFAGARGSAGNTVLIKRSNNDVVGYYHLSAFAPGIKVGVQVTAGQPIGLSGNTNRGSDAVGGMAKHLHFVYGVAQRDEARAAAFPENAQRGPFNPAQLPNTFNQRQGIGWITDPAPHFCATFPIQDGHPEHYSILGRDTKAQYAILFDATPPGGTPANQGAEPIQVVAANGDVALANASGAEVPDQVSDTEGYGALPTAPIGAYDTMSVSEMMLTEAGRRFGDADWANNLTVLDERGLWVDYARAIGVRNYMEHAILKKKERVEALLATYTAQRLAGVRSRANEAQAESQQARVQQQVQ